MENVRTDNFIRRFVATAKNEPTPFMVVWLSSFFALLVLLLIGGYVPASLISHSTPERTPVLGPELPTDSVGTPGSLNDMPVRIIIDRVGVDTVIENPSSRDVAVLDAALTKGVVRYPGSSTLDADGNIFLFGHSSHLPVVKNSAYQAFNDIEKLIAGDLIRVQSIDREYLYRVETVTLVDAESAWVDLSRDRRMLTLSTCNTFGKKQDRYVVEAGYVGSFDLTSESLTIAL